MQQQAAVQRLTTTEAAVLALLAIEGEQSAYVLMKAVTQAIGHVWAPARSGLFAALPRLAKQGLADARAREGKQLYRISRDGRAALDAWLETVEPGSRDTFFLKLFVGGLTAPAVLLAHVEQFVADIRKMNGGKGAIEKTNSNRGHDWFHRHLLMHAIARAQQELEWAAGVERALRRGPR